MNRRRTRTVTGIICLIIALAAYFAEKFPFYVYEEEELHTTLQQFFSVQHLVRLLPFLIVIVMTAVSIRICIWIRGILLVKEQGGRKELKGNGRTVNLKKGKRPLLMTVRWILMITFSVTVMFGGIWSGFTLAGIAFPVLACPTNMDQLMESSCYFLSHLPVLFEEYSFGGVILFFVSTIGFALLLGRTICGFLCPVGLIQDIMHVIRQKTRTEGISMTQNLYRRLAPVKWLMVLLMFGLVFAGGEFCSFCPAIVTSPVLAGMKVSIYLSGFMMVIVLVGSFFKRRFWCNICPLGFMIGLTHRISPFRVKKDTVACTECGACYEACPMGIKMIYTEREKTDVTDINCIMCGECVRSCPEDNALALAFAGRKFYTSSRAGVMSGFECDPHLEKEREIER